MAWAHGEGLPLHLGPFPEHRHRVPGASRASSSPHMSFPCLRLQHPVQTRLLTLALQPSMLELPPSSGLQISCLCNAAAPGAKGVRARRSAYFSGQNSSGRVRVCSMPVHVHQCLA